MKRRRALLVVDVQRDFCPGGALPVNKGDEIIKPTNELISLFEEEGSPVFFTRDWHPPDHCSFKSQGGIWPPHCVRGTPGADFHRLLRVPREAVVVSKGSARDDDTYSTFEGTDLEDILRKKDVQELYVVGLATDYCVKDTVLDGLSRGFMVELVSDCVKGVNVKPTDSASAVKLMLSRGAKKTTSARLRAMIRRVAVSSSS